MGSVEPVAPGTGAEGLPEVLMEVSRLSLTGFVVLDKEK